MYYVIPHHGQSFVDLLIIQHLGGDRRYSVEIWSPGLRLASVSPLSGEMPLRRIEALWTNGVEPHVTLVVA